MHSFLKPVHYILWALTIYSTHMRTPNTQSVFNISYTSICGLIHEAIFQILLASVIAVRGSGTVSTRNENPPHKCYVHSLFTDSFNDWASMKMIIAKIWTIIMRMVVIFFFWNLSWLTHNKIWDTCGAFFNLHKLSHIIIQFDDFNVLLINKNMEQDWGIVTCWNWQRMNCIHISIWFLLECFASDLIMLTRLMLQLRYYGQ